MLAQVHLFVLLPLGLLLVPALQFLAGLSSIRLSVFCLLALPLLFLLLLGSFFDVVPLVCDNLVF